MAMPNTSSVSRFARVMGLTRDNGGEIDSEALEKQVKALYAEH
jgi:hypothetical protein